MTEYIEQGVLGLAFFLAASNLWTTRYALAVIARNTQALTEMKQTIRENTKMIQCTNGRK